MYSSEGMDESFGLYKTKTNWKIMHNTNFEWDKNTPEKDLATLKPIWNTESTLKVAALRPRIKLQAQCHLTFFQLKLSG